MQAGISPSFIQGRPLNRLSGLLHKRSAQCSWDRIVPRALCLPRSVRAVENGSGKESRSAVGVLRMSDGDQAVDVTTTGPKAHPAFDALIQQFISPQNGNVTATVEEYLDLCDHALLTHLHGRIKSAGEQTDMVSLPPPK